jgi:ABC-type cobalamin transport system ATPase subunit
LAVRASPAILLLALDAGVELDEMLELENKLELEELELATRELDELELSTAVLLTWPPEPPLGEPLLDDPPPQLGSTQAHSKQALKRLYMFGLNIVIIEDVSKGIVMFATKRELIAVWLLLTIVHK